MVACTQEDVFVIPVAPYDPHVLLPRAVRRPRTVALTATALCFGAASVAFSVTLALLLALHF